MQHASEELKSHRFEMASLGLSWALAQTVDGALKLSREAALAASDDNVQPLALLACEKFGATLAISSFTQRKVEAMLRKQAATPIQKFLHAKIGYAKGGSIGALSNSSGGIRFLCLASALISGSSNFDAAIALEGMIRDTAEDKAMSPTLYQLKDLLDVLEPMLNRARFLDEVAGYWALLKDPQQILRSTEMVVPSPPAIQMMVESFRELARIGPADAQSLKLTVGPFAPWVAAFARWSIEVPPVVSDDQGHTFIDQPHSQVTICISADAKYDRNIEIDTIHAYNSIQKVISAVVDDQSELSVVSGMVSLDTYSLLLLQDYGLHESSGAGACLQAIPCAIHYIKSILERANSESGQFEFQNVEQQKRPILHFFSPFPSDAVVNVVMNKFLRTREKVSIHPLPAGLTFRDLPEDNTYVQNLYLSLGEDYFHHQFYLMLGHIVANILALSLLLSEAAANEKDLDMLVKYTPSFDFSFESTRGPTIIREILAGHVADSQLESHDSTARKDGRWKLGGVQELQITHIIDWALSLLGHEVSSHIDAGDWVASSYRGQVIMPRIILAHELPGNGFACLAQFPGTLMLETQKDRRFSLILSKFAAGKTPVLNVTDSTTAQYNAYPKETIKWQLVSKAEHLELSMGWSINRSMLQPLSIIPNLMHSVMLGPCDHSADAELESDNPIEFISPGENRETSDVRGQRISVYPIYGNENLKKLALASTRRRFDFTARASLVNRGACINCAIRVCKSINCGYVIL
jgi:hypothetical protein